MINNDADEDAEDTEGDDGDDDVDVSPYVRSSFSSSSYVWTVFTMAGARPDIDPAHGMVWSGGLRLDHIARDDEPRSEVPRNFPALYQDHRGLISIFLSTYQTMNPSVILDIYLL